MLKRSFARLATSSALFISACLGAVLLSATSRALVAAEPNAAPQTLGSVAIAGFDDLSAAFGQIAKQLGYEEQFKPLLEFANGFDAVKQLNPAEPIIFSIATDGDKVAPFLRIPLSHEPTEDDLATYRGACDFINEKIAEKTSQTIDFVYSDGAALFTLSDLLPLAEKTPYDSKALFVGVPEGSAKIIAVNVNLAKVPKELIEAGTALLRQKISELASDADEEQLADIEQTLEYYYGVFDSLAKIEWALFVDEGGSVHSTSRVAFKSQSYVAKNVAQSYDEETRWAKLSETPDAIAYSVEAGVFAEQAKKYNANHFKFTIQKNLSKPLDALKDDEVNYAFAKKLVDLFSEILESDLQADSFDFGAALLTTPAAVFCGTTTKPDSVKEVLDVLAQRLKEEFPDEFESYVKLNADKIAGYEISKFDASEFRGDLAKLNPYLNSKSLSIRFAVSDSAVVFACGLGEAELDALLRDVLEASLRRAPQPHRSVFDLAKFAQLVAKETDSIREEATDNADARAAFQVLDLVAASENAVFTTTETLNNNVVSSDSVFPAELFRLIGEAIPIIVDRKLEDSSVDLDDIFDE